MSASTYVLGLDVSTSATKALLTENAELTAEFPGLVEAAGLIGSDQIQSRCSLGGNLFHATVSSGDPIDGTPGLDGLGTLSQGFLELSNVSIVTELVDLISAQRAYELNSRAVQASDEMLQQLNGLVR